MAKLHLHNGKVILTIAPTGGMALKKDVPQLPVTPEEIAADVKQCYDAGASVVAVHARREDGEATCEAEVYTRINRLIRAQCPDIVINNSTGGGVHGDMVKPLMPDLWQLDFQERIKGMDGEGAEMCTLDAHTVVATFGGKEILVATPSSRCKYLAEEFQKRGIKPEWECFSLAHMQDPIALIEQGFDEPPYFFNFVLGATRGFQGSLPYTPKILQMLVEHLPDGAMFNVSGIGPSQLPATTHALLLGGHIRVGLEDNTSYARGVPATNVMLVERAVRIIRELGFDLASGEEARGMMGIAPL